MKRPIKFWMAMALGCALFLTAGWATNAAAQAPEQGAPEPGDVQQQTPANAPAQGEATPPARVHGTLFDSNGKPFVNVTVTLRNATTGQTYDAITDSTGRYLRTGIPSGNYKVSLMFNREDMRDETLVLTPKEDRTLDFNFKELKDKDAADAAEAAKHAEEIKAKFAAMKVHFDAGLTALDLAKQARAQYDKAPKDQQASIQGQLDQTTGTAITELKAALDGTAENDPNRSVVLSRLGDAYETDLKYKEAADNYSQSVALKPDPGIYNNLGNCLARTGKADDAKAAYMKAIGLDPMNTAMYWRNLAVGLYNTGQIKDSVDPLRKATDADPKNAQAWYLLGAALVNTMEFKTEGDKITPIMQPGTVEAYQKAIDLDPNGPYAAQAKQGLDALQAMGLGIDTKVNSRPAASAAAPKKK